MGEKKILAATRNRLMWADANRLADPFYDRILLSTALLGGPYKQAEHFLDALEAEPDLYDALGVDGWDQLGPMITDRLGSVRKNVAYTLWARMRYLLIIFRGVFVHRDMRVTCEALATGYATLIPKDGMTSAERRETIWALVRLTNNRPLPNDAVLLSRDLTKPATIVADRFHGPAYAKKLHDEPRISVEDLTAGFQLRESVAPDQLTNQSQMSIVQNLWMIGGYEEVLRIDGPLAVIYATTSMVDQVVRADKSKWPAGTIDGRAIGADGCPYGDPIETSPPTSSASSPRPAPRYQSPPSTQTPVLTPVTTQRRAANIVLDPATIDFLIRVLQCNEREQLDLRASPNKYFSQPGLKWMLSGLQSDPLAAFVIVFIAAANDHPDITQRNNPSSVLILDTASEGLSKTRFFDLTTTVLKTLDFTVETCPDRVRELDPTIEPWFATAVMIKHPRLYAELDVSGPDQGWAVAIKIVETGIAAQSTS
jgi:hypothetical protein